ADGSGLRNTDPEGPGDLLLRSDLSDPTGGASLVAVAPGISSLDALLAVSSVFVPAPTGIPAEDTANWQNAIDSVPENGTISCRDGGVYYINGLTSSGKSYDLDLRGATLV